MNKYKYMEKRLMSLKRSEKKRKKLHAKQFKLNAMFYSRMDLRIKPKVPHLKAGDDFKKVTINGKEFGSKRNQIYPLNRGV